MDVKQIADSCAFDTLFTKKVPHILEMIFLSLDYYSFNECLEVNKAWNGLLGSESYKVKAKLLFHKEIEEENKELFKATVFGEIGKIRRILSNGMVDVNSLNRSYHSTALIQAVIRSYKEVVQLLLHAGADPNMADKHGKTPLHLAGREIEVVKALLDAGADPDRRVIQGNTPIHLAAYNGNLNVVKLLMERGADPTKRGGNGRDALAIAAMKGQNNVVIFLLERGIDPTKRDRDGKSPFALALEHKHKATAKILLDHIFKSGNHQALYDQLVIMCDR